MKKILLALPMIAVLSACVSTQSNGSNPTIADPIVNTQWTDQLVEHKSAMRSCILANKDIQSINYLNQTTDETVLIVKTKMGSTLSCAVNPTTNQVTKIQPTTDLPSNLNTFYPVGKRVPDVCRGNERIHDEEGRLMGIICY